MSKSILLLGKGYIGMHLYNALSNSNKVNILSKDQVNYSDRLTLLRYLTSTKKRANYIINCSGFCGSPNVDQAEIEKHKCWELNVTKPTVVNNVCRSLQIPYIHISSGCIYTGDEKLWSETDAPNFGMMNSNSSFYSKSKHAYEIANSEYGLTIRIRMPFDNDITSNRSILNKLLKYDDIIDFKNSKTYVPDLCKFIEQYIQQQQPAEPDVVNFVNPKALYTKEVVSLLKEAGMSNPEWKYVPMKDLHIRAERSNCELDITKLNEKYNYYPLSETEAIKKALQIS
mgnify:FL=1